LKAVAKRSQQHGGEKGITFNNKGAPLCYKRPKNYESLFATLDAKMIDEEVVERQRKRRLSQPEIDASILMKTKANIFDNFSQNYGK